MKKLLSVLSAVMVVGSSAASVVSCGAKPTFKDIFLVSDTGKINDKSFNESGYDAGNGFAKNVLGEKNNIAYAEPTDAASLKNSYSQAVNKGAKTLILPGFQHQENTTQIQGVLGTDKSAVFIDGDTDSQANIIGLKYRADISGFEAGLSSAIWYFQNHKDATTMEMATYGGIANPVAVTAYMSGFLASIDGFNRLMTNQTFKDTFFKDDARESLEVNRSKKQTSDATGDGDKKWFTQSFTAGDGKDLSNELIADSEVIFAVAGPQTADTLGAIETAGKLDSIFVDGVDTDQALQYPKYNGSIITSGLKNIVGSTEVALAHTKAYKDTVDQTALDKIATDTNIDMSKISFVNGSDNTDASAADYVGAGKDWDGMEAWFDGDFAHGGDNKVSDDLYSKIVGFLGEETNITVASTQFFSDAQADGATSKDLLAESYIQSWLDKAKITETNTDTDETL